MIIMLLKILKRSLVEVISLAKLVKSTERDRVNGDHLARSIVSMRLLGFYVSYTETIVVTLQLWALREIVARTWRGKLTLP